MAERSRDWFRQSLHDLAHARNAAAAIRLDRYYIPTRYPNGFDEGAPLDYFLESDSREAIEHAEQVIEFVRRRLS